MDKNCSAPLDILSSVVFQHIMKVSCSVAEIRINAAIYFLNDGIRV